MVVSGLLIKIPYWITWQVKRMLGSLEDLVFYVDSVHDYTIMENILHYIQPPYRIVARNRGIARELNDKGINVIVWPVFPKVVVMARHAFHRFPIAEIKKIGMKHGTYHFKKMIHPRKYNAFDLYLFATESEAEMATQKGVRCGAVGGIPRLDTFSRQRTLGQAMEIKQNHDYDPGKKTLLFTTTWDGSGLSAVDRWIDSLEDLTPRYNVFVSLHPMMSDHYKEKIKTIKGIKIAESDALPAYMLVADLLISDTSSVMGEFCFLNKPIITFSVEKGWRLTPEIREMIQAISIQIDRIDELETAISRYMEQPELKQENRLHWKRVFYGDIQTSQGKLAGGVINSYLKEIRNKG